MQHSFFTNILRRYILWIPALFTVTIINPARATNSDTKEHVWYDGTHAVSYHVTRSASPVVKMALEMLDDDLQQVTGMPIKATVPDRAALRIIQLDRDKIRPAQLRAWNVPLDKLNNQKEAFFITTTREGQLVVIGSDARGTAYGILELSRLAGVSPWIWWSDVVPKRKNKLSVADDFQTFQSPSVEYRGIFLNDEDWSLQPWSWKTFSPSDKPGLISAYTYREIFKLLLRLRANTIWPGMHGITTPFYLVPGAKETADSCGIIIGTSHCEPLMRNNVGEWKESERGEYNYMTNRDRVLSYWAERLQEVGKYENLYTIGMRGIHDGHMQGVNTMEEKVPALQNVLNDQRNLLSHYVQKDITKIPQVFVPYKEVLDIMDNGLEVPDDVTLMWCDDNYGYMTRLSDEKQQQRAGGGGVYYHLSYWGRPHDYMWLSTTQPGLIYNEMKQAYIHNARKIWIVNVHDLKTAAYGMEMFLDMAWDINAFSGNNLNRHLQKWLEREFGESAGESLFPVMHEFYRLCGIRKPEFMGWTQVELSNRKAYPRGRSHVIDTEFSFKEFGNEAGRYMSQFDAISNLVDSIGLTIAPQLQDAYFSHVAYQVQSSAAMARKMLEAQRARSLAMGQCDESLWSRDSLMLSACARSMKAYHRIRKLTHYYNHEMANGKWRNSMSFNPRDLPVFCPPSIPVGLTDEEIKEYAAIPFNETVKCPKNKSYVAFNACEYTHCSSPVKPIQMLGHSMMGVALPEGECVTYHFTTETDGDATLLAALVPTQPNDAGDIRISISIDNEKPAIFSYRERGRTDIWKENVLRNQARIQTKLHLSKGEHSLMVKALDKHVVLDQFMIDFMPNRKYYTIPTSNNIN